MEKAIKSKTGGCCVIRPFMCGRPLQSPDRIQSTVDLKDFALVHEKAFGE
jgi:hypothetical protein